MFAYDLNKRVGLYFQITQAINDPLDGSRLLPQLPSLACNGGIPTVARTPRLGQPKLLACALHS